MRNWNRVYFCSRRTTILLFSAYLWGIETIESVLSFLWALSSSQPTYEELKQTKYYSESTTMSRSQPTYEELKLLQGRIKLPLFKGSQPTYEELKPENWHGELNRIGWFSAYLWGIETTVYAYQIEENWYRSQPTYEELKLIFEHGINQRKVGSQPTYEELKLDRKVFSSDEIVSSQPTYEELKHSPIRFSSSTISVLSLPMRNWNTFGAIWEAKKV